MLWVPATRLAMVAVATPLLFSGKIPRLVDPSSKVAGPPGVPPEPDDETAAVKVTDWSTFDGFDEEVRVVVVGPEFGKVDVLIITPTMLCSGDPVVQPVPVHELATIRSGLPSPSTSATARAVDPYNK
jgi:hypothetical protein